MGATVQGDGGDTGIRVSPGDQSLLLTAKGNHHEGTQTNSIHASVAAWLSFAVGVRDRCSRRTQPGRQAIGAANRAFEPCTAALSQSDGPLPSTAEGLGVLSVTRDGREQARSAWKLLDSGLQATWPGRDSSTTFRDPCGYATALPCVAAAQALIGPAPKNPSL